jgi:pSer/pThr/pTyr-binding forkhead associated (FHA) protein
MSPRGNVKRGKPPADPSGMAQRPPAMLFLPPLPPLQLREGESVSIGRSRSCDLSLRSPDASRRHVEIFFGPGGWRLRDLDSTNGTYVNGERVGERLLRPGDRIEIGSDAITFCEIAVGLAARETTAGGEAQTMMTERPALESFQGSLAEIPTFAVLQILEMGRKTGCLHTETDDGPGRIWLLEGSPQHADTKLQRGFDAAVAVVHATVGRFRFEAGAPAPERTIDASVTELLLEASRILDEGQQSV